MSEQTQPNLSVNSNPALESWLSILRAILIALGPLVIAHGITSTTWEMYVQVILGIAMVAAPVIQAQVQLRMAKQQLVAVAKADPNTVTVK
jgi:hypothetical protein